MAIIVKHILVGLVMIATHTEAHEKKLAGVLIAHDAKLLNLLF